MANDDRDDLSFADEMAQLGVTPLGEQKSSGSGARARRSSAKRVKQAGSGRGKPPIRAQKAKAQKTRAQKTRAQKTSPSVTSGKEPSALVTSAELAALRDKLRALEAERERWRTEKASWQQERAALVRGFECERDELTRSWQAERTKQAAREREARQRLAQVEAILAGHQLLVDGLYARGCADVAEAVAVVRGLLEQRPRDFLASVDMISAEHFARLLGQRVAFVAEGVELDADESCVVIRVPPERCEITGGSDILSGFRLFASACERARVRQVTVVGGSPAYRRQLQRLSEQAAGSLRLNLVSGTQRRTRKRADADMRKSDLIIIWGGTELDHSVTAVYTRSPEKTLRVPHRGISRMLLQAAEELKRR